jgi:hypothetical protein
VAVADVAHGLEVAGHGGDAAGGGADDGLGHEGSDVARAEALELGFEFAREALGVLCFRLVGALPAVGEAGGDQGESVGQEGGVGRATHHVAAGGEGAERVAVVALPAGDEAGALGLADLEEVLAGKLDGGFVAFGAGGTEIGVAEAAGFVADEGFREFLGRLVGEQGGVDVGDLGELFGDRGVDPWMAVAEAGDGGTAGAVDDFAAVGGVQKDPFPSRREHGIGEHGAVEDAAHGGRAGPLMVRLRPGDSGRDRGRTGLDAAEISIDRAGSRGRLAHRVVEKGAVIIMQPAPVQRANQDENPATLSIRMRRCRSDERRAKPNPSEEGARGRLQERRPGVPPARRSEKKRKTIGCLFIDVFDTGAKRIRGADFLAQGTLYPDVIESVSFAGGPSVIIKSHDNVGGLPSAPFSSFRELGVAAGRASVQWLMGDIDKLTRVAAFDRVRMLREPCVFTPEELPDI